MTEKKQVNDGYLLTREKFPFPFHFISVIPQFLIADLFQPRAKKVFYRLIDDTFHFVHISSGFHLTIASFERT